MEATAYESLLSKVYGSRPESRGIDAEMYRQMLDEYQNLVTRSMYETQQERIEEFKRAFAVVRECVQQAIADGALKIMHKATEADIQSLELMTAELGYDFYDRFELKQIIANCNALFTHYGLNPNPVNIFPTAGAGANYTRKYGN